MAYTIEGEQFEMVQCTCAVRYLIPSILNQQAKNRRGPAPGKHSIHCPNGHSWYYTGESDADKMRRERDRAVQKQARLAEEIASKEREIKRIKKRSAAGVCSCCNRTFTNMARHMKTKHPELLGDNVTKLKKA